MKTLLLILLIIPTYIRTADRAEYEKYKAWCNQIIYKHVEQTGKITLLKVNGQYTDSVGNFKRSTNAAYWYGLTAKTMTAQQNEAFISRMVRIQERRKTPTVKDFYMNWLIQLYADKIARLESMPNRTPELEKELSFTKSEYGKIGGR